MTALETLQVILELLVGGFTSIGSAMGSGLSDFATSIIYTGTGESQTLSPFMIILVIMAAIGLSLGLFRWVLNFITSLGNRNR